MTLPAMNAVPMATSLPTPRALDLACGSCTRSELTGHWANLALLSIWHMHAARAHHAAGCRVGTVARAKAGMVAADAARLVRDEIDRRAEQ